MRRTGSASGVTVQFEDYTFPETIHGVPIRVRVTGSALHALWGSDYPRDPEAFLDRSRDMIEDIVAEKFAAGEIDGGVIVIGDYDLDM